MESVQVEEIQRLQIYEDGEKPAARVVKEDEME